MLNLASYLIKNDTKINPNVRKMLIPRNDEFNNLAKSFDITKTIDQMSTLEMAEVFWLALGNGEIGYCKTCNKRLKFGGFSVGYGHYCNSSCQMKDPKQHRIRGKKIKEIFPEEYYMLDKVGKFRYSKERGNYSDLWAKRFPDIYSKLAEEYDIESKSRYGKPLQIKHKKCGTVQMFGRTNRNGKYLCSACYVNPRTKSEDSFLSELEEALEITLERQVMIGGFKYDGKFGNLLIDYNGMFWHSTATEYAGLGKSLPIIYHRDRAYTAEQNGYTLIQIFEDEWLNDREKVINRLKHQLRKSERIFARKCELKQIRKAEAVKFLRETHIANSVPSAYSLGLFYEGELKAVATFGKTRFGKRDHIELLRFATKGSVIGGLSKLMKEASRHYKSDIISYSDNFGGNGEGYRSAGFLLETVVEPGYFYFDKKNFCRVSRLGLQKHNYTRTTGLKWDNSLNEEENALRSNLFRIYDAGKKRWLWKLKEVDSINN